MDQVARRQKHKHTTRSPLEAILRSAGPLLLTTLVWRALVAQDAGPMTMSFSSPEFDDGGTIPDTYTCTGSNISPPFSWSELPAGTRSLALVIEDPDAPNPAAARQAWVHWVVFNIPPSATQLPAGVVSQDLPVGTQLGVNDWKTTRYEGPCPPSGTHRYVHRLYALDTVLLDMGVPTRATLQKAMQGHVLSQAQWVGTYARP